MLTVIQIAIAFILIAIGIILLAASGMMIFSKDRLSPRWLVVLFVTIPSVAVVVFGIFLLTV